MQQLIQYSHRAGRELGIVFVDLKKAYDSVSRELLWEALVGELGVPDDLVQIIRNMYIDSRGVLPGGHQFRANVGVKQGDGASPELFALYFDRAYPHIVQYF